MYDKLTQKDIEQMEAEIEHRKLVVRKEAIAAVKEAREHGDLSENFEYHAAKKDKNKNESRIRYLVGMNNTVTLYFEDDDETETYKIVTTIRENSLEGKISDESPIGKAIMGHRVGDRVLVEVNDKVKYYVEIKSIENTVDDGSDKIRGF